MTVEFAKPIDFSKTLPRFEERFPMEMAILRLGGVYPGMDKGIKNPYTYEYDLEYRGNIGEHCFAVALYAKNIADRVLGENHTKTKEIESNALVHDSTKGYEIMRRNAVRIGKIEDAYSPTAYETIKLILEHQKVSPTIVEYMAKAGSETGHNSLKDFVKIENGKPALVTEENIAEMIVHLADDMTFTSIVQVGETAETYFLTTAERQEAADFPNKYPFLYTEGFGFNQEGEVVFVKDVSQADPNFEHVKTYSEWQVWIAKEMAKYLVGILEPNKQIENPEKYLKDLVNANLR
ncbi:hypothetical protein C4559_01305 [Candidatus Microgenomates bacterium]|nr:MAG: hypothetical protein C4559_01305 [Candidatus Microgenomates bacterium]